MSNSITSSKDIKQSELPSQREMAVTVGLRDPPDKSKYGYRMLQRMGWEEGKGLGSKEEGPREHIKVKMKRDNKGLGRKKGRDEDWIEHQDAFDQILANLTAQTVSSSECSNQTGDSSPSAGKALLEIATESKRLLYKKFLKSKDLSVQSSEDLDCVLARKRRKLLTETGKTLSAVESEQPGSTEKTCGTVDGIRTVTSHQSLQEYFSAKLNATKRKISMGVEVSGTNEQCPEQLTRGKNKKKSKKRTRMKTITTS